MLALITGGASNVGTQIAQYLRQDGHPVTFGSRSGKRLPEGFTHVPLDWDEPSTFSNPFPPNHGITSIYIVSPIDDLSSSSKIIPFIQIALEGGVRMFVYLSATTADSKHDCGGLGKIPKFLETAVGEGRYKGLDYVILRPTWFIDNLLTERKDDISQHNQITTCVPNGKMPFVASSEIAKIGYEALVHGSRHFKRRDPLIIGPQLLSYSEVAVILTKVLGRKIVHNVVSEEEMRKVNLKLYGVTNPSEDFNAFLDWLAELDRGLERGTEEGLDRVEGTIIGTIDVAAWVQERRAQFE
ncbi:ergot alkaloid A [Coprinopsis sp. MPI-PUGE-AT-0042]|nr:ergot alkaloid A [Coprinopsis sp. MPI-PUGE-AT-0042]